MQYCVRRQGKGPRRVGGGGGKYAKLRAAAYAGGRGSMEHAQVAFTNPNWRTILGGAGAPAPPAAAMMRGAITNIGTDHEARPVPNYAAPVTSATFHVRHGANAVASPAFETAQAAPFAAAAGAYSGGASSSRFARPFHAEAFGSGGGGGNAVIGTAPTPAGKRSYATLAVGGGGGASPPVAPPQIGMDPTYAASTAPSSPAAAGGPAASVGREPFVGAEAAEEEGESSSSSLPLYWYGAAPSGSTSLLGASPWHRDAPSKLLTNWGSGRYSNGGEEEDAADGEEEEEEEEAAASAATIRRLAARVEQLAQRMEQQCQRERAAADGVNEEWLASAILGLFVICVADTLRK